MPGGTVIEKAIFHDGKPAYGLLASSFRAIPRSLPPADLNKNCTMYNRR